ncbi:DUF1707 domain-containing protein [Solihabitans fulvus]|uniref:DUF1707 domain-containing protein n=1 Tax=Solihabitans fulvus TaxID=1892852 RepID=A0A5B2WKK0_9PSEU|nr:DUF1707 domain-containing protein [Solihabitans fulvus]KAA2251222.1 DUF1707 domain-containing protein [Solihabitans fulvus]
MSEFPSPDIRIGDTEREQALTALGEHMSAGRLDIDEYGDRTAKVAAARTRRELVEVFTDLPDPRPSFAPAAPAAPPPPRPAAPVAQPAASNVPDFRNRTDIQRATAGVVSASWLICILLVAVVHLPGQLFILPIALSIMMGSIWGNRGNGRDRRRNRRRDWR